MSRRGWVLFATMGVIWGIPYLLIRIAVRDVTPPTLVFLRTAPAAIALLPFLCNRPALRALRAHARAVFAYTLCEVGVPWLLLFRAEQRLSSSLTGLLVASVPLIAVATSALTRHEEPLGPRRILGLGVGLAGVAVLVGIDVHGPDLISVGEVLVVAVGYATGPFIISRYLTGVPAIAVVAASFLLAAAAYAPVGLTHLPRHLSPEEILSLAILVVVCTVAAFLIFFRLIAEVGPARATVITYVNPAVAVLLGVALLHERFSLGVGLGFPLVLIGSFLGTGGVAQRPGTTGQARRTGEGTRVAAAPRPPPQA